MDKNCYEKIGNILNEFDDLEESLKPKFVEENINMILDICSGIREDFEDTVDYLPNPKDKVADWYKIEYPSDKWAYQNMKRETTFNDIYNDLQHVYELTVDDSIVRERIFQKMTEIYNEDYEYFYNGWLGKK